MSLRLYMDQHVQSAITEALGLRDVDVLTAQEDGTSELPDPQLLDRAGELDRVLFSRDVDLVAEATRRQRSGESFTGVIYAHQLAATIGRCVADLELVAKAFTPEDMANQVLHLPLR